MMTLRLRDTLHHTYAEYLTWPEVYGELINGSSYIREPPSPSPLHQELAGEVYYQIRQALEGRPYRVYMSPLDVRLPKSGEADEDIDTVVQPDLFIVSDLNKLDARGLRGAPDWLAEVLSPGTTRHDRVVKLPVYERAGVLEVWLIHPTDQTLSIYRLEEGRYGHPIVVELKGRTSLSAIPEVTIDWDRIPKTP